jgi:polar amino acid transport system ATP-binding protein
VLRVVETLAEEGMTLLMVTHEMNFARKVSRPRDLHAPGPRARDGAAEELFGNPQTPELKQFLSSLHNGFQGHGVEVFRFQAPNMARFSACALPSQ